MNNTATEMKMTTDIPPGIATPDSVPTRFGTLKFIDGFTLTFRVYVPKDLVKSGEWFPPTIKRTK